MWGCDSWVDVPSLGTHAGCLSSRLRGCRSSLTMEKSQPASASWLSMMCHSVRSGVAVTGQFAVHQLDTGGLQFGRLDENRTRVRGAAGAIPAVGVNAK